MDPASAGFCFVAPQLSRIFVDMASTMEHKELSPFQADFIKQVIDEAIPVHRLLGIILREVKWGYALLHLPFKPELVGDPRLNRWHGGIIAALMDSAGGAAAVTTLTSEKDQCASIDLRVDFLRPGQPMDLLAEGRIVRDGNSVIFVETRVWHEETGEVITEGRVVLRVKRVGNGEAIQDAKLSLEEE